MKLRFLLAAALLALSAACTSPVAPLTSTPATSHRDGSTTPPDSTQHDDSGYTMGSGS